MKNNAGNHLSLLASENSSL